MIVTFSVLTVLFAGGFLFFAILSDEHYPIFSLTAGVCLAVSLWCAIGTLLSWVFR